MTENVEKNNSAQVNFNKSNFGDLIKFDLFK